jgi:hypothetical protein
MLKAWEIDDRIKDWYKERGKYTWSDLPWNALEEMIDNRWGNGRSEYEPVTVAGLRFKMVEQHGGEGEGDKYWIVFECSEIDSDDPPQLFKVNGWYASYDGSYLDGDVYEVKPKEVTRIKYVRVD